jgi:CheY-like chemotaxis protein
MELMLAGKKVFVVEDDVSSMAIYAVTLKRSGAMVVQDHWNTDTLHMLEHHMPVDAILLDLMLRMGITGYEIFDQIKSSPIFSHIPVIAVSASDPEVEIPRTQSHGFAGFISKPINLTRFPAQVASCISGNKVWVATYHAG